MGAGKQFHLTPDDEDAFDLDAVPTCERRQGAEQPRENCHIEKRLVNGWFRRKVTSTKDTRYGDLVCNEHRRLLVNKELTKLHSVHLFIRLLANVKGGRDVMANYC